MSDKRLLRKCGNGKSFLVGTGTFQSNLRDGAQKEPEFERDNLENQSSGNHLKENPEVLSRLGHRAESKEVSASAAKLHNRKGVKPGTVDWERQNPQGICQEHRRHFVQEGRPECQTDYRKDSAVES
ncbi:MAG: hypothetical protein J7L95_05765 [Prolixibacteraceae bacterium]|nr:hypothetical protein [Prolixibacteraceae bacterium]